MNDDDQTVRNACARPIVVHPGPLAVEDLLRHADPAPDEETEQLVAAIYADRRRLR
jgi:hypothetical protein